MVDGRFEANTAHYVCPYSVHSISSWLCVDVTQKDLLQLFNKHSDGLLTNISFFLFVSSDCNRHFGVAGLFWQTTPFGPLNHPVHCVCAVPHTLAYTLTAIVNQINYRIGF